MYILVPFLSLLEGLLHLQVNKKVGSVKLVVDFQSKHGQNCKCPLLQLCFFFSSFYILCPVYVFQTKFPGGAGQNGKMGSWGEEIFSLVLFESI